MSARRRHVRHSILAVALPVARRLVSPWSGRMQSRVSPFSIALALLGTIGALASAQTPSPEGRARLTGRVADAMGYSIPKAEILVTNTALHAESGADGR